MKIIIAIALIFSSYFIAGAGFCQSGSYVVCGAISQSVIFDGGVRLNVYCNKSNTQWIVSGVGTNSSDAYGNATNFGQLLNYNKTCILPSDGMSIFQGGFKANFSCSGMPISGLGGTVTETGINSLGFSTLYAQHGLYCTLPSSGYITLFNGGVRANYSCNGNPVSGYGTNITDAANNALGFAGLPSTYNQNKYCYSNTLPVISNGLIKITYYCAGIPVYGYGGSVTVAAQNALYNAGSL